MSGSLESRVERRFLEIEERLRESELKNAEQLKSEEDADGNVVPRAKAIWELTAGNLVSPLSLTITASNPNNKRIAIGLAIVGLAAAQTATIRGFNGPI